MRVGLFVPVILSVESSFVPEELAGGELPRGWSKPPQGKQAESFWNDRLVLQKRPLAVLKKWQAAYTVLEDVDDPEGLLACAAHQIEIRDNSFWIEFTRQDIEGSPCHGSYRHSTPEETIETFEASLPMVLATARLLRGVRMPTLLFNVDPSRGQANRRYSRDYTRQAAAIYGTEVTAPLPEEMPVVFAHGDALLKNMVLTRDGYRLIDWEDAGPSLWGADFAHAVAWVMLRVDTAHWERLIRGSEEEISSSLGCTLEQWRLLVFWTYIGELVFWREGRGLSHLQKAAGRLLTAD